MRTRVFVSHSAKSDADKAVLDQLVCDLKAADLDVWVDYERLRAGADWNKDITTELQNCHAAIVLFSKQALQSEFVKYEVSALVHRRRVQSVFELFPLMLDDIDVDAVEKTPFYEAIRLVNLQLESLAAARNSVTAKLRAIEPTALVAVKTIEGNLIPWFRRIEPVNLTTAAGDLGFEIPQVDCWAQGTAPHRDAVALAFMRGLLAQPIDQQIKALLKIEEPLGGAKNLAEVFRLAAPCWVDDQAAQTLADTRREPPGKRAAVVNATQGDWTCRMFLRRACPMQDVEMLGPGDGADDGEAGVLGTVVPVGRDVVGDLEAQIMQSLCRRHDVTPAPGDDVLVQLDRAMAEEENFLDIVPVQVIDLHGVDARAIAPLLERFKRLTLVVMSGPSLPDNLPPELEAVLTPVVPLLEHGGASLHHNEMHAHYWYNHRVMAQRRSQ